MRQLIPASVAFPVSKACPASPQPQAANTANEDVPQEKESAPLPIRRHGPKLGRNDPCPLDPKKKFKNCCGALGESTCIKNVM